ncbi:26S proteasome, regulatory subunit Rpn7 [Metarhizium album ARSEF 1941]|uniref:COP9 signalosome complex subunit 1 n=1 Tax=Metarhizium album (strain ARSEF 1941) TaxID=1081103 RepID=A0A0B2WVJ4_METAS|nr:26S proteasome, regulatory subunit Rpn7 [Metarhizium album ARSEF 1941]KHN97644.1 26S proteasome, regulatory subunit Rpn7 [Metarhizium album ARSEF 1941]
MAASDEVLGYLAKQSNLGGVVVRGMDTTMDAFQILDASLANSTLLLLDLPKLDLGLYLQNYVGRTRFDRLFLIGQSSVPLCVDALKAAVVEAKAGNDVNRYRDAWDAVRTVAPNEPEAQRDDAWIERTEMANKAETARLEGELKGYRNNLIKESIRMGNEDLGKHFESIGKLNEATEAYTRMRQDVSTTKHIIDCGTHLANVSLHRRDYAMVLNNIGKITAVQNGDDEKALQAYTRIASGIALLGMERFDDAAKAFLGTDSSVPSSEYGHIASPNDVAVYGGLLALAIMDRKELQQRVLDNQSFRTFLEHEPHIRKAISLFVNGRYSSCLSILEGSRADYLLDIYLQSHIPTIYSKIRTKCIVQYFVPFSCVTLESLDAAFAQPGTSIGPELIEMIRQDVLKARIDAKNKLLVAVRPDARAVMQKEALRAARKYEREAKERLRRISLAAAGLHAAGGKKTTSGDAISSSLDEAWYEEDIQSSLQGEGLQTAG